jgi:2-polyprenyl-3-methyl-5-hydroxy-6-metoxy-1,4-benzoquinol methylase
LPYGGGAVGQCCKGNDVVSGLEERSNCPLCASEVRTCLYRCNFAEGPIGEFVRTYYHQDPERLAEWDYWLDLCGKCGLIYQRFIGTEEFLAELYGEWINQRDPAQSPIYRRDVGRPRSSRDAHEIYMAAAFLGKKPSELATFDFGMGWGLWARMALALGCRSYGHDLSPQCREHAARHGVAVVDPDDLGDLRFDFINTDQVLEHVANPGEVLHKLAARLAPGGILKIAVPNGDRIPALLENPDWQAAKYTSDALTAVQPLEHINCYSTRTLNEMAKLSGLRVVRPSYPHRLAFLRHAGSVPWRNPKEVARAFARPWHRFHNPHNIFAWLQRP